MCINLFYLTDFVLRLYHDLETKDPLMSRLCELACTHDFLDLCQINTVPRSLDTKNSAKLFPMIWRFLPSLDPEVEVMMSRDLDSRLTEREAVAVREWLESGKEHLVHLSIIPTSYITRETFKLFNLFYING